jgi:hypothetical protein
MANPFMRVKRMRVNSLVDVGGQRPLSVANEECNNHADRAREKLRGPKILKTDGRRSLFTGSKLRSVASNLYGVIRIRLQNTRFSLRLTYWPQTMLGEGLMPRIQISLDTTVKFVGPESTRPTMGTRNHQKSQARCFEPVPLSLLD